MNVFLYILASLLVITMIFGNGFNAFILSILFTSLFNVFSVLYTIVYHFITGKWYTGVQRINDYFVDLSKAKFQYLSVLVRQLFNKMMCYKNCVPFGTNIDKPIGYYFALNKIIRENVTFKSGLNNFGMFWSKVLDLFDRKNGGLLNAILQEEMRNEIIICKKWVNPLPDYLKNMNLYAFKVKLINDFIQSSK